MSVTRQSSELLEPIKRDPVRRARMGEMKRAMHDAQRFGALRLARRDANRRGRENERQSGERFPDRARGRSLSLDAARSGYVEALGGELEVTAKFPDGETIRIA